MKDNALYVIHLKECLDRIDSYIQGVDKAGFLPNPMMQEVAGN